jgi:hypothetical protein
LRSMFTESFWTMNERNNVHVFWECQKIWRKSPPYFWLALHRTKVRWRFHKILWPSQNIWTLKDTHNFKLYRLLKKLPQISLVLINKINFKKWSVTKIIFISNQAFHWKFTMAGGGQF